MKFLRSVTMALLAVGLLAVGSQSAAASERELIDVPVLRQSVPAGSLITEDMITTQEIAVNRLAGGVVTEPTEIVGMENTRSLRAGLPLFERNFRDVPSIRRGQLVKVMYEKGGLSLSVDAEALQDGNVGDMVKVINPNSKSVLYTRVQRPGVVVIN